MSILFSLSNLLVLPLWLLMIVAPNWNLTKRIMSSPLIAAAPAALYAALVLPQIGAFAPTLLRPSLDQIRAVLGSEAGATIGWVHFLAFDLFVGRWIYLDSRERGMNPWLMGPILFATLMFGPMGFLLYLIARAAIPGRKAERSAPALL